MVELQKTTKRKARKEHKCTFCENTIAKEEWYQHHKYLQEGEFIESKYCFICVNIVSAYLVSEAFEEYFFEDVEEWLKDAYCSDCKKRLRCTIRKSQKCEIIRRTVGGN